MFLRLAATLGFACALGGLSVAACGPSFQVVYEGDARFEHCYAIDETPTVSMQEKTDCWTQWMKYYTYGQTRNRVDYAAMRAAALQEAHATPTDEAVMSAAPGGGTGPHVGVDEPVTTNPFATPPKTMSEADGGLDSGAAETTLTMPVPAVAPATSADAGPAPPAQACTFRCRTRWQGCRAPCKGSACRACDKGYDHCMKKCF